MTAKALFPTLYDEKTKVWSGLPLRKLYDANCSVGERIYNSVKSYPTNVVQISNMDERVVTFGEVHVWAARLALYLKSEGLTHKDVVGIIGNASTFTSSLVVGCLFNATPFHAVAYTYMKEPQVIQDLYETTKPKIMFCDGKDYEIMKEVTKAWNPKYVTLTGRVEGVPYIEDLLKPHPMERFYQPLPLATDGNQIAAILCSSGTSGKPKSVAISHRQLNKVEAIGNCTDVILTSATLDWMTGLMLMMLCFFYGSSQVIFNEPFNGDSFIRMIEKYKVTLIVMAPWQGFEVYTSPLATEQSLSSVRMSIVVGGWLSMKILQRGQELMKNAHIVFAYGATETGTIALNIDQSLASSVGKLPPGVRIKIIDDEGNSLGPNQVGQILIDIGVTWQGYVANPEDTASTFRDGWIDLGDLGYFDDDNNLFLVDRKKDVLKYKSKDFWPNEIEQIITELPDVENVCVVGVRNTNYTDAAGALVIKKPGAEISKEKIIEHVAKRVVVEYKQLNAGVQFVDSLPMNNNGKVVRNLARKQFESLMDVQES
ncbi:PREDICTED: probable 4-coumarate--CoA ligase 3 [Drosophila arizonae]|uniref:Probable 4-coumarate--CoA ligase 3 n=1 Tax=Drosophila arizonae TaxID=7263 RepID=A0ABM1PBU7_DROAR|nr:PREDICTED: probable 4-coumarate--CoA ligase 3 [Drosophila arizonae]